jgi:hypothetical protein
MSPGNAAMNAEPAPFMGQETSSPAYGAGFNLSPMPTPIIRERHTKTGNRGYQDEGPNFRAIRHYDTMAPLQLPEGLARLVSEFRWFRQVGACPDFRSNFPGIKPVWVSHTVSSHLTISAMDNDEFPIHENIQ